MASFTIDSTATTEIDWDADRVDIQPLGTADVYVTRNGSADPRNVGLRIQPGEVFSFVSLEGHPFYVRADADGQDVRVERP